LSQDSTFSRLISKAQPPRLISLPHARRNPKSLAMKRVLPVLAVFLLIALLLAAWTLTSPPILETRSASELSNSVFSSARTIITDNLTHGAGSHLLAFGLDFPDVAVPAGMRSQFRVYGALLSE